MSMPGMESLMPGDSDGTAAPRRAIPIGISIVRAW